MAVYYWPPQTWAPWRIPVRYLLQYQCQVLSSPVGDAQRAGSAAHAADTIDLDPLYDALYVLTVGGQPQATAIVSGTDAQRRWYLALICGHHHTGAGALLLQHLQASAAATGVPGIALSAFGDACRDVYRQRGFRSLPNFPDGREMVWDADVAEVPPRRGSPS